jgi:hypothetical protein
MLCASEDGSHVIAIPQATADDGLLHALNGMLGQELQHANIVAGTRARAMLLLQRAT